MRNLVLAISLLLAPLTAQANTWRVPGTNLLITATTVDVIQWNGAPALVVTNNAQRTLEFWCPPPPHMPYRMVEADLHAMAAIDSRACAQGSMVYLGDSGGGMSMGVLGAGWMLSTAYAPMRLRFREFMETRYMVSYCWGEGPCGGGCNRPYHDAPQLHAMVLTVGL